MSEYKREEHKLDLRNYIKSNCEKAASFTSLGWRDVIWCPLGNEPTFLTYKENGEPDCKMCNGNYEPETHPFICHINKPYKFMKKD